MSGKDTHRHSAGEKMLRHAVACALVRFRQERHGWREPGLHACMFPALLCFAREYLRAMRRTAHFITLTPTLSRTREREKGMSSSGRDAGPLDHLTTWPLCFDSSPSAKLVVSRWFSRGVSGRLLWLIAEGIMDRRAS